MEKRVLRMMVSVTPPCGPRGACPGSAAPSRAWSGPTLPHRVGGEGGEFDVRAI